jgi:acyl-CoA synthetase (AMP-forming)/AMP-acid ligase II
MWGVQRGDKFGLIASDPIISAQSLLTMMSMGLWVAPLDPTITYSDPLEIDDRAKIIGLHAIVADREVPIGAEVSWLEIGEATDWRPRAPQSISTSDHLGGLILASSGTTGRPKIMELSVNQLLEAARSVARHNELTRSDRGFNPLPLWHVNAIVVGLLSSLVSGASLVLDERFHRTGFWSCVGHFDVTWINAVPAIIARLTDVDSDETVPQGIRFIRSASAPLAPAQRARFEMATGITVLESYGMTEAASQICAAPLDGPRKIGSVGRPIGVELRITAFDGGNSPALVSSNVVGHIEIRGPSVIDHYAMTGYEDRFDKDKWLRTGDMGYIDEDGYVFLIGRTDDVINRGGEKIMPRELEEVAMKIDGVLSAAVIAREHDVYGQVPDLFVQLRGVTSTTPLEQLAIVTKELHDVLVNTFARTRRPISINVIETMPSNATGKIQKRLLANDGVNTLYQLSVS